MSDTQEIEIEFEEVASNFYLDNSLASLIIGPIGSGKTFVCVAKLERFMYEQEPSKDGIRYSKWAVVRNTYRELEDTTMASFKEYFGTLLKWKDKDAYYIHGDVHAIFHFRSLDKPEDTKKLLSLNLTGCYFNELREIRDFKIFEDATSRMGRYPLGGIHPGTTHKCCIADSNAFPDDKWVYEMFISNKPDKYSLFLQPPAVLEDNTINPKAENIARVGYDYYADMLQGKTENWIDIMLKVKFVAQLGGKPVYPEYSDNIHFIQHDKLQPPSKQIPLICGGDNGRWSGFLIGQVDPLGRVVIFDEITSDDVNLTDFSEIIKSHMQQNYSEYKFETWIDPWAANQRGQITDDTMRKVYNAAGLHPRVSQTGSPTTMVEAVKKGFGQIIVGQPKIVISSKCKKLVRGLRGEYSYRRINVSGEKYADKPDKGPYSHICNAFEFLIDGMGASRELLASTKHTEAVQVDTEWSPI